MKPVVAIDIDGTLGDYHRHFLTFAEQWYGRKMPDPADINPGLPLHKFMETSKSTYRECKLAYRQGGLKRSMPVYPNAANMVRNLRARKWCEVWICTTRPYLRLDNIDPDTRHWLRRNGIQFDGVLYGEHKYRDLVSIVGRQRIAAVLDDLPEMCMQSMACKLPTVLRDQPYNRLFGVRKPTGEDRLMDMHGMDIGYDADHFVTRVMNLNEAEGILAWLVRQWYDKQKGLVR